MTCNEPFKRGRDVPDHALRQAWEYSNKERIRGDQVRIGERAADPVLNPLVGRVSQQVAGEQSPSLYARILQRCDNINPPKGELRA